MFTQDSPRYAEVERVSIAIAHFFGHASALGTLLQFSEVPFAFDAQFRELIKQETGS